MILYNDSIFCDVVLYIYKQQDLRMDNRSSVCVCVCVGGGGGGGALGI